ncbi:MAG: hypothetical protein E6772_16250 [Dysgonomonas sp.]|nr:hypothetical protein [Dysgonomonas sp.]
MEKYHVSKKQYMSMPCALISLMMLDAPKVLYGKKIADHTEEEKEEIALKNRNLKPVTMSMAEILKQNGK